MSGDRLNEAIKIRDLPYDPALESETKPLRALMEEFGREFADDPDRRALAGDLVLAGIGEGLSTTEAFTIGSRLAKSVNLLPSASFDAAEARSDVIRAIAAGRPGSGVAP